MREKPEIREGLIMENILPFVTAGKERCDLKRETPEFLLPSGFSVRQTPVDLQRSFL